MWKLWSQAYIYVENSRLFILRVIFLVKFQSLRYYFVMSAIKMSSFVAQDKYENVDKPRTKMMTNKIRSSFSHHSKFDQWRLKLWNSFSSLGVPIPRWNIYTDEVFGNLYDRSLHIHLLMGIPQVIEFWFGFLHCSVLLWSNKFHHDSQQFRLLISAINQRQHNIIKLQSFVCSCSIKSYPLFHIPNFTDCMKRLWKW